ncbi:MAG: hypothetical protein GF381_00050 [Candidatus Pacebacteria bacterium]|nr:hypothetical protein [Candidatus Paceibacterota bacterium]
MNNVLTIIFATTTTILTVVLAVVGIQLILVLSEFKKTLGKINQTLEGAEKKFNHLVEPLANLGGIAAGLKTGVQVFEGFVGWLSRNKDSKAKGKSEK